MVVLKCVIVDDEISAIKSLERVLKQVPELELVATFSNPVEALAFIRTNDVYLVFLDINMAVLSGLDIAMLISNKVIFTTGHQEFALKSYEFGNVVDYLTKPIFFERVLRAVKKAITFFTAEEIYTQVNSDTFLIYKNDKATVKINHDTIIYIEAKGSYSIIYMDDREETAPLPIWELEKSLPKSRFSRINKSSIANTQKILDEDPKEILLIGGHKLKPGKAFKDRLGAEKS